MTAEEFQSMKAVLVANKMVDANAPDQTVLDMHNAALAAPDSAVYKQALAQAGVKVGPNWLHIIGLVGGAAAIYFIWRHYQKRPLVDGREYPDPVANRHQLRSLRGALGALRGAPRLGSSRGCASPRLGRAPKEYEFEPEIRLEGFRRKTRRK